MGQTLTHGVYLPDEGERNCYNGLAANWQLLDNSVGTIAEHTTALSGKAPLVHTHTKSDITDFPVYGTTAGTICEGNDSRLSDARTPVAHTHTKSDVTDLLNSNFIPSANNSYDLGSSSYQWNNLYAKNYYYNGTAWGLDKDNIWVGTQYFSKNLVLARNVNAGTVPSSSVNAGLKFYNGNGTYQFAEITGNINANGTTFVFLTASNKFSNGTLDPNGTTTSRGLQVGIRSDGSGFIYTDCGWRNNLVPHSMEQNLSLGTSTNKWKTLNGCNPGALSLPNYSDTTYIDISGSIVPPSGETEINKNLGFNEYTPPVDGWLSIRCDGATFLQIYRNAYNCPGITSCDPSGGKLVVTLPVRKNVTYTIRIKTSGTTNLYQLYPCEGNV